MEVFLVMNGVEIGTTIDEQEQFILPLAAPPSDPIAQACCLTELMYLH